MPTALFLGMTEERFWESTPDDLEPYRLAYKMRQQEQIAVENFAAWMQGVYIQEAIACSVFVAEIPNKRKQLPSYPEKPYELKDEAHDNAPMTESEIETARLRERIKMDNLCRMLNQKFANGR